jgi:hypothetical protein
MFALFHSTVAMIDAAEVRGDEITRDIGYATVGAILEKAVDIIPTDLNNIAHRLCCARQLIDLVSDLVSRGLDTQESLEKIDRLIVGAIIGMEDCLSLDTEDTRLDFYLPPPRGMNGMN